MSDIFIVDISLDLIFAFDIYSTHIYLRLSNMSGTDVITKDERDTVSTPHDIKLNGEIRQISNDCNKIKPSYASSEV